MANALKSHLITELVTLGWKVKYFFPYAVADWINNTLHLNIHLTLKHRKRSF